MSVSEARLRGAAKRMTLIEGVEDFDDALQEMRIAAWLAEKEHDESKGASVDTLWYERAKWAIIRARKRVRSEKRTLPDGSLSLDDEFGGRSKHDRYGNDPVPKLEARDALRRLAKILTPARQDLLLDLVEGLTCRESAEARKVSPQTIVSRQKPVLAQVEAIKKALQ